QGKPAEAKKVFAQMKQIEEDTARIRELADQDLKRSPHNPNTLHELGKLLLRTGSAEQGLDWLRRALDLDPHHRPTHALLADFYERAGDSGRAARHRALAREAENKSAATTPGR